jgi:trans-2,3-dihydro-3-hydroxyanthranilate isomerase
VWLERGGDPGSDLDEVDVALAALEIDPSVVGFDASALGGKGVELQPAVANAGVPQLMVPLRDPKTVAMLRAPSSTGPYDGIYCFAPLGQSRIKARFFAPGLGVTEDPATGSAAAALGVYLGARAGSLSLEIEQGAEIGRPSFISLEVTPGRARVGGEVHLAAEATLVG